MFTSGEAAWASVSEALQGATDSVHMSSWWWESDFELVRPLETHASLTETERRANTVMGHLEATAATKRIMIGQFLTMDGILSGTNVDDALTDHGADPADDFEFMGALNASRGMFELLVDPVSFSDRLMEQADENGVDLTGYTRETDMLIPSRIPTRNVDLQDFPLGISIELQAASWHQKFGIIDNAIAFVGGMNVKAIDWDTDEHAVWNFRRMPFEATMEEREAVRNREDSATGPRKDYIMRIEGPIVEDVNALFAERWTHLIDIGADFAGNSSSYNASPVAPIAGGVQAQVTATMPEPFWDHAIAETWFNAVESAEEYIFIEDQYFRIPMLVEVILERMEAVPALELVVITKPINELTDPGCEWTFRDFVSITERFPDRFTLLQLITFDYTVDRIDFGDETDAEFVNMDTHSKMFIVDDVFMSVGSANKNNRGVVYEGELNVAVYDAEFVRDARRHLLELILPAGITPMDGVTNWREQLVEAASWNAFVRENWGSDDEVNREDPDAPLEDDLTPRGFVYNLAFRGHDHCLIEGVGPDMF